MRIGNLGSTHQVNALYPKEVAKNPEVKDINKIKTENISIEPPEKLLTDRNVKKASIGSSSKVNTFALKNMHLKV